MKITFEASQRLAALAVLMLVASCGADRPATAGAIPRPPAAGTASSPSAVNPSGTPAPQPAATLPAPAVADFRIVAYQGDAAFGGHEGHFAAAFALDKPVVLLYFGGL